MGEIAVARRQGRQIEVRESRSSSACRLEAAYVRLRRSTNLIAAAACLKDIGRGIGMPHPAVIDDYSSSRLLTVEDGRALTSVLGWDPAFVEQWLDQRLHLVSPIAAVCRMTTRPFCWDAQTVADAVIEGRGDAHIDWPLTPRNGFYGGITIPVHMPLGRTGSVSWYSRSASTDIAAVLDQHGDLLRLVGLHFLEMVYAARMEADPDAPRSSILSERELECLSWAALGRTDTEIGALIHRAPTTARFHIDNAVRKLGARNRTQAVAIAAQQGLIHPLPAATESQENRGAAARRPRR
jgi:LuxR family transcriptional regulator, quorum-sensing system regulator CciR